jgi:hypothetical protein
MSHRVEVMLSFVDPRSGDHVPYESETFVRDRVVRAVLDAYGYKPGEIEKIACSVEFTPTQPVYEIFQVGEMVDIVTPSDFGTTTERAKVLQTGGDWLSVVTDDIKTDEEQKRVYGNGDVVEGPLHWVRKINT